MSYARMDGSAHTKKIRDYFNRVGYNVFLDEKSISGGEEWGDTIKNNIKNCDVFVLIVTSAALNSSEINRVKDG